MRTFKVDTIHVMTEGEAIPFYVLIYPDNSVSDMVTPEQLGELVSEYLVKS